MQLNQRKAAIIGCGFVGSATAFCLMQSGLFSEIVLQDVDKEKAEGEAMAVDGKRPLGFHPGLVLLFPAQEILRC